MPARQAIETEPRPIAPQTAEAPLSRPAPSPRASSAADAFAAAKRVTSPGGADALTPFERCLPGLLDAIGWVGEPRHLVDALPHVDPVDDLEALARVLERLGYRTERRRDALEHCEPSAFPLVALISGRPTLILGREPDGRLRAARPGGGALADPIPAPRKPVPTLQACPAPRAAAAPERGRSWFADRLQGLGSTIWGAALLTLAANLFALATPLYTMLVYNTVIPARAFDTLAFGVAIIAGALLAENQIRRLRERLVARLAARLHGEVMREGVAKVLSLPIAMIESVTTTAQLAQFKRFENVVGLFQGPVATALLDLPFILLFLVAIAMISPTLALIPLALIAVFLALATVFGPLAKHTEARTAEARRETQELVRETVLAARSIRAAAAERAWLARLSESLDEDAAAAARHDVAQQLAAHGGQALMAVAAAAMLCAGALLALDGAVTIGALIAAMMLMWRVLAPIQAVYLSLGQLRGVRQDVRMIDQLMRIESECRGGDAARIYRRFDGDLRFDGVAYRQPNGGAFILRGVSFELRRGERVGVLGPADLGPSTLLRLALGLHQPTVGAVALDGLPLTQLDVGELRSAVAYVAARPDLFYGTVAQNMRLARADLTDDEIAEALDALELPLYPEQFPEGLDTRLTDPARAALGPATLRKLCLARALLSERPVLLLDHPMADLDAAARAALIGQLERRRPDAAALIATGDRRLLETCDRILVLARGQVAAYGPPASVLDQLGRVGVS